MAFHVFTKARANDEIRDAATWYEEQQSELGHRFLDELEKVFRHLENDPLIFQKKYGETREAPLNVFPFVVTYQVEDDTVIVFAVFHTSRNPSEKPR